MIEKKEASVDPLLAWNGLPKILGILSQVFHHHILLHDHVFWASSAVAQLSLENGELLFEAEYEEGVQQVSFPPIFLSPRKYQKKSFAQTTTKNKRTMD